MSEAHPLDEKGGEDGGGHGVHHEGAECTETRGGCRPLARRPDGRRRGDVRPAPPSTTGIRVLAGAGLASPHPREARCQVRLQWCHDREVEVLSG
jgi:hypothetical protein